jgi:4-aminobutyrate aminotransferase
MPDKARRKARPRSGGPDGKIRNVLRKDRKFISPSYTRSYDFVVERGKGAWLWDINKKRYLDFTAGIAVANAGHNNPEVVRAVMEQADMILHNAGTDFYNKPEADLAEVLVGLTPGRFPKKVFFTNSGTESVECALKLSRWHSRKPRIISFLGSFHGRTYGSMTLSGSKLTHRDHFTPLVPSITHTPYAYCYRCPFGQESCRSCGMECLAYLEEQILGKVVPPDEVAAVFVEPVQGEGGYIVPPKDFMKGLRSLCRRNGFLFVADEVQTGFCRTGKWFASEHFGVTPDIITLAKGIAGGLPLGACVARADVMDWPPGAHASTFSGNPLSCRASLASISFLKKNKMEKHADKMGKHAVKFLKELQEDVDLIGDVRGLGLMVGIELVKDRKTREPAKKEAGKVLHDCFRKGLLVLSCGESVVRLMPPLVIEEEELQQGLDMLAISLKSVRVR